MADPTENADPEIEEEVVAPLELGTDLRDLFKKTGIETLEFVYNDKRWVFTYRALTWAEHFKTVEDAWTAVTVLDDLTGKPKTDTVFSAAKYYEDAFMLAIQTLPGDEPVTRQALRQLDSPIIQKLTTIVPGPKLDDELETAKKV